MATLSVNKLPCFSVGRPIAGITKEKHYNVNYKVPLSPQMPLLYSLYRYLRIEVDEGEETNVLLYYWSFRRKEIFSK